MKIFFDPDFDGGCWPGPLNGTPPRPAAVGEAWVGPLGLRGILETALGLGGLFPSESERTFAFSKIVRDQKGFWTSSAAQDEIGVARTLLRWIDWLKIHGWDGRPPAPASQTPRLSDLARIAPHTLPGNSDRLIAILSALEKFHPDIASIDSFEPIDRLLPLWRSIFAKLASLGVSIKPASLPVVPPSPSSDLRRSLTKPFTPSGDGSLILFRPLTPLDGAESVAARLASLGDLSHTIIITPDVTLDEALRRFALPVTGARESINDGPFLQILPLVLAMGWDPPDPQRALELLLLADGPIPASISRPLRSALQEWPAVGSPDWSDALKSGLDKIPDPALRSSVQERLDLIFHPDAVIRSPYPASALLLRARAIKKWAAARLHFISETDSRLAENMADVIAQCDTFEKLVGLSGLTSFTEPQLLKLTAELSSSPRGNRRYDGQAGLASLSSPAALAGPARRVVWWDFTLESADVPNSIPLSDAEVAALAAIGVQLTPPSVIATNMARRRRRPFELASESLLLVCPKFGDDHEVRHHHPLWDEVLASSTTIDSNLALISTDNLEPRPTYKLPLLPLPAPQRSWKIDPKILTLPSFHSPSSLQSLIGCSFNWALQYLGRLGAPETAALTDNDSLMGKLAHEILASVLRNPPHDGQAAFSLAEDLFDQLGPKLAAPLFLPGAPVQLGFVRKATASAARELVTILKKAGLPVIGVEYPALKESSEIALKGRLDLLAGPPPAIIDLKWSSESYHRERLKAGTAAQLAAYSFIMKSSEAFPPVAYFIIRSQHLLAQPGTPLKNEHIQIIDGPAIADTWKAFFKTSLDRLSFAQKGEFEALAIPLPDDSDSTGVVEKDELTDTGFIALAPPCKFCSFGYLCGRLWEQA